MTMRVTIGEGDWGDYRALARYHYLSGRPARPTLTLRATSGRELAGVLVVAVVFVYNRLVRLIRSSEKPVIAATLPDAAALTSVPGAAEMSMPSFLPLA